jgi:hypothetical protein
MPHWLSDPRAPYVIAAYGVSLAGLLALLFFSWRAWQGRRKEWQRLKGGQ